MMKIGKILNNVYMRVDGFKKEYPHKINPKYYRWVKEDKYCWGKEKTTVFQSGIKMFEEVILGRVTKTIHNKNNVFQIQEFGDRYVVKKNDKMIKQTLISIDDFGRAFQKAREEVSKELNFNKSL